MTEHITESQADQLTQARAENTRLWQERETPIKEAAFFASEANKFKIERDQLREQLTQAQAEVERLTKDYNTIRGMSRGMQEIVKERDQLRAQLAALQYDGELPEPAATVKSNPFCSDEMSDELTDYLPVGTKLHTADQVRQAISNDRASAAQQRK
jgi:septal ring factor EnvC (AmiA/AmiB activator)